jgi:glucosyl-dolichyl phosphate glucuronosyltransferase
LPVARADNVIRAGRIPAAPAAHPSLRLIAAICTNRSPDAVRPALSAVCEQSAAEGATALLVTSGLDDPDHALHAAAAERLGASAVKAPAGLSLARNKALETARDADVLAFVDDDAVPQAGWLAALTECWRAAGADVACIGGAILPDWERRPPVWLTERVHTAYSLLDLGEGLVELDPRRGRDAWGANLSFRTAPLREVGGFAPERGPWSGVPLFGDESAVQRRLAERGYRVLYAGDVRVSHRIGAERMRLRELWRRELYRGAGADASPISGAGRALKAAAGLAVALARRDRPLAGERFARLGRNCGAALRPLLRRRLRRHGWPGR